MLALRLPKELEERLDALAKSTGRTKSYYARKAIALMMEDLEDIALAQEVLAEGGERYTLDEVKAILAEDAKSSS